MILLQVAIVLYAVASAFEEAEVVKAFRAYVPINYPGVDRFHSFGAMQTVIISVLLSVIAQSFFAFCLFLLWYWLVFDILLNILTGKAWHYTGQTAKVDKLVAKYGGGKMKAAACAALIIILNILL